MGWWLANTRTVQPADVLTRFDPVYWTVDFPRPMMAAVTTTAPDALRIDTVFYRKDDLAGLIWESADRFDHPLLSYATDRDYRGCRLSFRWQSSGLMPLDAINGPTLTIEGRAADGTPRAWYVRLWNYAVGDPQDATITLDFAALDGGFLLPGEADPVWAGDVDRLFISLIAPGFDNSDGPLDAPAEASVALTDIVCTGSASVLAIGDVIVPEHGLRMAGGYDDSYNLTPARLLRTMLRLGYRGPINHYVGMSHYFRLEPRSGGYFVSLAGDALNVACAAWHRDFAAGAKALGYDIIWSLSYELLDQHCWNDWKQRSADGAPAQTGYTPPSTLMSPAHDGAMRYLRQVAQAFVAIGVAAGLAPHFQVGEPWWWLASGGRPCLYDASAVSAFAPVTIASVRAPLDAAQRATLDRAGTCLAASTAALVAAVRDVAPATVSYILTYLPTLFDPATPEWRRASMPVGWARPAFDVLQLEDYDWAAAGDTAATKRGVAEATARLGYPDDAQHYFSGYVTGVEARDQWRAIDAAADAARARGVAETFVWALPEVMRDGFVHFDIGEQTVQPFDDVLFPLALGREAEVVPGFSTTIITAASGVEQRNVGWAAARTSYDVGPGIRSEADIAALLTFYRARLGPARGFRLRDPFDDTGTDELIGVGDGGTRRFALVRRYGDQVRRITRPVAGSVTVAVNGAGIGNFVLDDLGWVELDAAPAAGSRISASFVFDVPVRFTEDRLSVTRATFLAGEAPSVPLIEVREG